MNNGSYDKTIIIKGNINIYTPYDSFEHKTTDNMLLDNINFIKNNYKQNNIIISSELLLTICYTSNLITNDLYILNIYNNKIITLFDFIKTLANNKELNINQSLSLLNLYTFIKFFCDNKIKWDINKGISCLGTFIPGAFSKNDIINYISKIIRDYNKKNNKININEQILIKNNIKPFRNNIYDIYYNLYYANEWLIMNKFNK